MRKWVTEVEFIGPATMPVPAVTPRPLEGSLSPGLLPVFGHSDENDTDRDFKNYFHCLDYSRVMHICLFYFVFQPLSCSNVGIRKGTLSTFALHEFHN